MALTEEHVESTAPQYTDAHYEGKRGRGLLGAASQGRILVLLLRFLRVSFRVF